MIDDMTIKINEKWHILSLILLIIIGSFLRLYHLDYNSLWLDESYTLLFSSQTISGIWEIVSRTSGTVLNSDPTNPPLFYFIEHYLLVFGQSESTLRFVPAFLGILTIPVFFFIGREFADEDVGIIMAALLTISPFHVYYSQEARAYSPMLFLFSLSFFFFLCSLHSNNKSSWVLFGIFSGLALWMHYYTIIPLAILFSYACFWGISQKMNNQKNPCRPALLFISFGIVCLPMIPLLFNLYMKRMGSQRQPWGYQGLELISQIFKDFAGDRLSIAVLFLLLFGLGIIYIWKKGKADAVLLIGLFVIPVIISLYLAERMAFVVRYLLFLVPFYLLGISLGLKFLAGVWKDKKVFSILVAFFFLFQMPFLFFYYSDYYSGYTREDWRGASAILRDRSDAGDYIIVIPNGTRLPLDNYYHNKSDFTYEFGARNESEITAILSTSQNSSVYFVLTGYNSSDPEGNSIRWLNNHTDHVATLREIIIYSKNFSR